MNKLEQQISQVLAALAQVADARTMEGALVEAATILGGVQAIKLLWTKLNPPPVQPEAPVPVASEQP